MGKNTKTYTIIKKVWLWPGVNPWHFVYVDGEVRDTIQAIAPKHHMGMVRIRAKTGETVWETSLLPYKKENCYLLALKKDVRRKEGILDGDTITLSFQALEI